MAQGSVFIYFIRQDVYKRQALRRPDLLKKADLTNKEWSRIRQWKKEWKEAQAQEEDKE